MSYCCASGTCLKINSKDLKWMKFFQVEAISSRCWDPINYQKADDFHTVKGTWNSNIYQVLALSKSLTLSQVPWIGNRTQHQTLLKPQEDSHKHSPPPGQCSVKVTFARSGPHQMSEDLFRILACASSRGPPCPLTADFSASPGYILNF